MPLARFVFTLENLFHEYRLGISTHGTYGFTPGDWSRREHIYYGTVSYRGIFRILDAISLCPSDVFVDLGAGKGRVVCCCSLRYVAQVIGVDDTRELCDVAEDNLLRMRGRRSVAKIVHLKAEEFDYSMGTVFYMFHPFGPKTLKMVMARIKQGLHQHPRNIRIVYVNPKHDAVLEATDWVERYQQWPAESVSSNLVGYQVSFWRSKLLQGE